MHHALHVDSDVCQFEPIDARPAQMAMGKERERVARDLFKDGVVMSTRQWHRMPRLAGKGQMVDD